MHSHFYQRILAAVVLVALAATAAASPMPKLTTHDAASGEHSILQEPCLVSARIISAADGTDATDLSCMLQGSDEEEHGPVHLTIEGLTLEWAKNNRAWPFSSSKSTLFLENVIINVTDFSLKLPDLTTVDDMTIEHHQRSEQSDGHGHGRSLTTPDVRGSGDKKFLFIQVVFQTNYTVPKSLIKDEIFGAQPNFTDQFAAMSFDKLRLSTMPTNGADDGILTYEFPPDVDPTTLEAETVDNLVSQYLKQQVKIYDDFDFFLIIVPFGLNDRGTDWTSYSYFHQKISVYNGIEEYPGTHWAANLYFILNGLGRNFGLDTSNRNGEEFGDRSGAMGGAVFGPFFNETLTNKVGYNGAKSWVMGWYSDQTTLLTGGQDIDFEGRLCGVVDYDPADTSFDVIIRIDDPESELNYYIAFNRAIGFNADSPLGRDQVLVTRAQDYSTTEIRPSDLEAILNTTQPSYRIDAQSSLLDGIVISVSNIDDDSATPMCATVSVKVVSSRSPTAAPSVSMAPSLSSPPSNVPTVTPSSVPTGICGTWEVTAPTGPRSDERIESFRFDVHILDLTRFTAIKVAVAAGFTNMPYTIFFRPSTWDADGNWTQIASGNNGETDSSGFTPSLIFDQPVVVSADDDIVSFRIDMADRLGTLGSNFPRVIPETFVECPDCPFEVFTGQGSLEVGNNPPNFRDESLVFFGILEFCRGPSTEMPTGSASPTTTTLPTTQPSAGPTQAPTDTCRDAKTAGLPRGFFDDTVASVRHDIQILDSVDITGMRLVLPSMGNQNFTIFYRPSTWDASGNWAELASGTIEARGAGEFTDVIAFDQPLAVSESDDVISIRIDTRTSTGDDFSDNIIPIPPDWLDCNNCPFTIFTGIASGVVGDYPPPLYDGSFEYFMGSLEFCNGNSKMPPTGSASPTMTTSPTIQPSAGPTQAPTDTCRDANTAGLPRGFFDDTVASVRHDIQIHGSVDITGMRLVLPSTGNQTFTIFYRPSTWDASGNWAELASGTIEARGGGEFTDVIPFDQPLAVSESDDVISIRIDTRTSTGDEYSDNIIPIPPDWLDCDNCPFTIFTGIASGVVGDNPPPLYGGVFEYFMGSLEFCNGNSKMPPSALPSALSSAPSSAPSSMLSSTPSSTPPSALPSTLSSAPSAAPSSTLSSFPSSQPSHIRSTKGAKSYKSDKSSKESKTKSPKSSKSSKSPKSSE